MPIHIPHIDVVVKDYGYRLTLTIPAYRRHLRLYRSPFRLAWRLAYRVKHWIDVWTGRP